MDYTEKKLEKIIKTCLSDLLKQQPMLFDKQNNINEETVSSELSTLMKPYFHNFHVNCEYNRMTDDRGGQKIKKLIKYTKYSKKSAVKPDIIVHRQEDNSHNLLAIEIKMQWKNNKKNEDFIKLKSYKRELNYCYSLYLEIGEDGIADLEWF